jgi:OmcA/MtrC family decaheme c-type cytochrome
MRTRIRNANTGPLCWSTVLLLVLLLLAGCNDGSTGPAGPSGTDGVDGIDGVDGQDAVGALTSLSIDITDVTVSSSPVVEFTVTDQDGRGFTSLVRERVNFTFAKLVPGAVIPGAKGPANWQNYINREETPSATAPGSGEDGKALLASAIQGTTHGASAGGTLENLGGGKYRFTFGVDVTNITTPKPVSWQPDLTHRLGMQLSGGGLPAANAWYDFIPDTPGVAPATREIATTASCNACHDRLAKHGGGRVAVEYCVTCHNPFSTDANSGNSLDFKVMIHKIHRGGQLPRVVAKEGEYAIWGHNNTKYDFSSVVYPFEARAQHAGAAQRTASCNKCHTTDADWAARYNAVTTADGDAWNTNLSREACGSCHEHVPGFGEEGAAWIKTEWVGTERDHTGRTNDSCYWCHDDVTAPTPMTAHYGPDKALGRHERAQRLTLEFAGAPLLDPEANTLTARLRIRDSATGADMTGAATMNYFIGWGSKEYRTHDGAADGAPNTEGRAITISGITVAGPADGDGYYEVVRSLNADRVAEMVAAGGSGMLQVGGCIPDGGNCTNASTGLWFPNQGAAFAITDATPVARRTVASIDGCRNCHMGLHGHGGTSGRDDNLQTCAICHNSNFFKDNDVLPNTGQNWRGYGEGHKRNSGLMTMVHAIHNNSAHRAGHENKQIRNPAKSARTCTKCHTDTGYQLAIAEGVTGPTFALQDGGVVDNVATHRKLTPTAAACASCHVDYSKVDFDTGYSNDKTWNHIKAQGGGESVNWSYAFPDTRGESCFQCHGPGKDKDIAVAHGLK